MQDELFLQWKRELRDRVEQRLDMMNTLSDEEVEEAIDEAIFGMEVLDIYPAAVRTRLKKELFNSLRRLDVLQFFVEDKSVSEIMINGKDNIFAERFGRLEKLDICFESEEKLQDVIQQIVGGCNRVINDANPIVDARLPDGSRVCAILRGVCLNGPAVAIRRFPERPITMDWLVEKEAISAEAADFLKLLVKAGYNIFISGGTGSGKTTFLNALSQYIPSQERVATIEDSAELQLLDLPNLVRLETRNKNVDGCAEITIRDLIKTSLRMRPDRIIVGEVRGAEAFDMLQCMNTGHDGSMSTGHANSSKDMLSRLENMVLMGIELPLAAIRQQIASGIDVMVHLGRLRDHSRRVLEIQEVVGMHNNEIQLRPLYEFAEIGVDDGGHIKGNLCKREELLRSHKLRAAGL